MVKRKSSIKFPHQKWSKGGFLIEPLIALGILSIIAIVGYLTIYPQILKAEDAKTKANLNSVRTAFQEYYDDHFCFPKELPKCGEKLKTDNQVYIENFPCQPNGKPFTLDVDNEACPNWYRVTTNLLNSRDPNIKDIHCDKGCGPNCVFNYGISGNVSINYGCPLPTIIPDSDETPEPTQAPSDTIKLYACSPSGQCILYTYPELSECPKVYESASCNNECNNSINRCKNERGKKPADQK